MRTATGTRRFAARLAPVIVIALLVAACSTGTGGSITTSGAWARPSMAVAGAGAAYLTIQNTGTAADALLGGSSPVAKAVEVHETVDMSSPAPAASGGMGGSMASPAASGGAGMGAGVMGMQKIDRLEIPAGGTVELKPGGYHLMLIDLTRELKVGDTIEITLNFEKAGPVKIAAEIRAS